jgi:DNA polymerase-3 subunit beta
MKVSCLQDNLAKGLSLVQRAVSSRSSLPILGTILVATDGPRLKLAATNLEIGINCWIGAKIEDEGAIAIPSRLMVDFVSSLPPERIEMDLNVRTNTLHLKCARFEANMNGMDPSDFPPIPGPEENNRISMDADVLRDVIRQVTIAAATDESRPILTGVYAAFEGSEATFAAADGFRLSVRTAPLKQSVPEPLSVIIPARALDELSRISSDQEDPIEMCIPQGRNQIVFHLTSVDLVSQLVEGRFPDYKQIIPRTHTTRTILNTGELLQAVKTNYIYAREASNVVKLQIVPTTDLATAHINLNATAAQVGDNVGEVDATVEGQGLEIAFNSRYLIDVLSVIPEPQLQLDTTTSASPGVIRPVGSDDFVHVIMPMHITS